MEFLSNYLYEIAASVIAIGLGFVSMKYKDKYETIKEFLDALLTSLEDGSLTPEEIQRLVQIGKRIIGK